MNHLHGSPFAILLFAGCMILLLVVIKGAVGGDGPPAPMAKRFLTDRERAMQIAIEQVLPTHRIHAQVAMGALLQVPRRIGRTSTPADRNSFSQKIVDFVVQDRSSGAVVALIEVDDASHDARRDRARDAMTAHAGYRTIRIARSVRPTIPEVTLALAGLFKNDEAPSNGSNHATVGILRRH